MKISRIAAVLLGAALVAAGCSSSNNSSGSATTVSASSCKASIGLMAPITGPAASIGQEQLKWGEFAISQYNAQHKTTYKVIQGDTQLNPATASTVATQFVSNSSIVAVDGPAGSQEVQAVGPTFVRAGMPFISGSATLPALTMGSKAVKGFYRTVPNDNEQGPTDANYMAHVLGAKNVTIINDQSSYSVGLEATTAAALKSDGVSVTEQSVPQAQTDFSSLVSKVSSSTNVVFLPWQIASHAQLFGEQMAEQHKTATLFGSDGTDSPSEFHITGAYVSAFAPDITAIPADAPLIHGYDAKYGRFQTTFGPPVYLAAQILAGAITRACLNGGVTRANVESQMKNTDIPNSILGGSFKFTSTGDPVGAHFYIFKIQSNGAYKLVS